MFDEHDTIQSGGREPLRVNAFNIDRESYEAAVEIAETQGQPSVMLPVDIAGVAMAARSGDVVTAYRSADVSHALVSVWPIQVT